MRVVIVGAGNVATVFGRLMAAAGHEIIQVVSSTISNAQSLASQLSCTFSDNLKNLDPTADIYIVAVPDVALQKMKDSFFLGDKLIVHTAGAVSKQMLSNISSQFGVLYPLQSLLKEQIGGLSSIPLLIDANNQSALTAIEKFAFTLSPIVSEVGDDKRLCLHLAAVVVNNFTNHLYTLAADYCSKEGVDFTMLYPLIEETALRLSAHQPRALQTGPASRNDSSTLEKHLQLLNAHPELKKVYQTITESIRKQ
jgi:predicted short-subunit dehydrogenase-like oxidoreductase (DUF2520 family)